MQISFKFIGENNYYGWLKIEATSKISLALVVKERFGIDIKIVKVLTKCKI